MSDIMGAVQYPIKDQNWVVKHLYSYMGFIPFLGFIVMGYRIKAIRENIREPRETLPEWDDWGKLFMDGIMDFIIVLFYMAIPTALLIISILTLIPSIIGMNSDNKVIQMISALGPLVTICLALISSALFFVASLFLPMAIGIYAATGSVFSAINIIGVMGKILGNFGRYIMVILIPMVIVIIWGSVLSFLQVIPILGQFVIMIVALPFSLYVCMVSAKLTGDMFRDCGIVS